MHPSNLKILEESIEKQKQLEKKVINGKFISDQPFVVLKPKKMENEPVSIERWGTGTTPVTQRMLDKAVTDFVVEEMQPLSVVNKPTFINVARLGCPKYISVVSSRQLKSRLFNAYDEMKENMIKELANLKAVAGTADLWTKAKRSYLGVTAHWIEPSMLKREGVVLCVKRITGSHTYDILAGEISSVLSEFHIKNKMTCITTDNGSNFVKAFRVFSEDDENSTEEDDLEIHCLDDILSQKEEDYDTMHLPPHHRCGSHTLNRVAQKDTESALDDKEYKKMYKTTLAKCQKIWNKQNKSTLVADKIHEILGVYLKTLCDTRWNSEFYSLYQISGIAKQDKGIENLEACCDFANVPRFSIKEIAFLEEYCKVMSPLATAIDILQAEEGMFMGYLLPVISTIKERLEVAAKEAVYCFPLIERIQEGLKKRNDVYYEKTDYVVAACLHPFFKFDWLPEEKVGVARRWVEALFKNYDTRSNKPLVEKETDEDNIVGEKFFRFKRDHSQKTGVEELQEFLKPEINNLFSFHAFPYLKELFIRYNTGLTSSASVERLFSTARLILLDKRHRMSDDLFEKLVLLKKNRKFYGKS